MVIITNNSYFNIYASALVYVISKKKNFTLYYEQVMSISIVSWEFSGPNDESLHSLAFASTMLSLNCAPYEVRAIINPVCRIKKRQVSALTEL